MTRKYLKCQYLIRIIIKRASLKWVFAHQNTWNTCFSPKKGECLFSQNSVLHFLDLPVKILILYLFILPGMRTSSLAGSSSSDEMQDNDTLKGVDSVSTWKVIAPGFTHNNFKMENTFRIANARNTSNPTWVPSFSL